LVAGELTKPQALATLVGVSEQHPGYVKTMIYGFKRKLLMALLLTNIIVVSVLATCLYWSFHRGFANYLNQVEVAQLKPFTNALNLAYEQKGSWGFLQHNIEAWGYFVRFLPGRIWEKESPEKILEVIDEDLMKSRIQLQRPPPADMPLPPGRRVLSPPGAAGARPMLPPPSELGTLNWRLKLLDENGRLVFGRELPTQSAIRIPLHLHDEVIGWLSVERIQWLEQGLASQFRQTQFIAVVIASVIALLVSTVIALFLGRTVFQPISMVIKGIRQIARGNLNEQIEWRSNDEFQSLVDDVNGLAKTLAENRQLRRTMMADVSHELRTPLAVLQANIEAIQDGIRPCDKMELEALHKGVLNLSRLINDLFALSLADAGNLAYSKRKIDGAALLQRTIELYKNLFAKKNIQLSFHLIQNTVIYADPDRIEQVFANIFNNSYRYTDSPGKVVVTMKTNGGKVHIQIEDSYPGVTTEHLEKIFDRFFRVDKSRSREHGGSGLGLALCRSIVEAHDGTIEACQSSLGGLGVFITLPLVDYRKEE